MKFVRDFSPSTIRNVKSFDKLIGVINGVDTPNTPIIDILNDWMGRTNISKDFIDCCISVMLDTSTISAESIRKYGVLYIKEVCEYKRQNLKHYVDIGFITKEDFKSINKLLEKVSNKYNKRLVEISIKELTNFSIACAGLNEQNN